MRYTLAMSCFLRKFLATTLALACIVPSQAQSSPAPTKQTAAVIQKASHLIPQAPISVTRIQGEEEFGRFVSSDSESFTLYDVDQKANVTLKYSEVKKIKDGFGGYNSATHRHVDRRKNWIVVGLVVVGLAVLVGAAASSK